MRGPAVAVPSISPACEAAVGGACRLLGLGACWRPAHRSRQPDVLARVGAFALRVCWCAASSGEIAEVTAVSGNTGPDRGRDVAANPVSEREGGGDQAAVVLDNAADVVARVDARPTSLGSVSSPGLETPAAVASQASKPRPARPSGPPAPAVGVPGIHQFCTRWRPLAHTGNVGASQHHRHWTRPPHADLFPPGGSSSMHQGHAAGSDGGTPERRSYQQITEQRRSTATARPTEKGQPLSVENTEMGPALLPRSTPSLTTTAVTPSRRVSPPGKPPAVPAVAAGCQASADTRQATSLVPHTCGDVVSGRSQSMS